MVGNTWVVIGFLLAIGQAFARPEFALFPTQPPLQEKSRQACMQCHGNLPAKPPENSFSPRPPILDNFYSMDWHMYELDPTTHTPPVLEIPEDRLVTQGKTFYDGPKRKMVEIYQGRCINIFSDGNDFSCKFLSLNHKTFLIRYKLGDLKTPKSCCVMDDFWAPRTDVLRNMGFQQETTFNRQTVQWWLLDSPLPGPFGYGTFKRTNEPFAFWFPVIGGWVQQNFSNYSDRQPPASAFAFPNICRDAPACEEP